MNEREIDELIAQSSLASTEGSKELAARVSARTVERVLSRTRQLAARYLAHGSESTQPIPRAVGQHLRLEDSGQRELPRLVLLSNEPARNESARPHAEAKGFRFFENDMASLVDGLQDVAGLGFWIYSPSDDSCEISGYMRGMFDLDSRAGRLKFSDVLDGIDSGDRQAVRAWWSTLTAPEAADVGGCEFHPASRPGRTYRTSTKRLRAPDGAEVILGTVEDVTSFKRAEEGRRRSSQRFADLLSIVPVGIALFDDSDRITQVNQGLSRMLGEEPGRLRGRHADALLAQEDDYITLDVCSPPLLQRPAGADNTLSWTQAMRPLRVRERGTSGGPARPIWCELHVSKAARGDQRAASLVVFADVTRERDAQLRLRQDYLNPALLSRRGLSEDLERAIERWGAERIALLFCDLENFSWLNNTLGHDVGDEILAAVGGRLKGMLPREPVARLAGGQFVILIANFENYEIDLSQMTDDIARTLSTSIRVDGQVVPISAQIGVATGAMLHKSAAALRTGASASAELIRFAHSALRIAKSGPRGARSRRADEMSPDVFNQALRIKSELSDALVKDEISVKFQAVRDGAGQIIMFESFVWWRHPVRGALTASEFLPYVRAFGLLRPLEQVVVEKSVDALRQLMGTTLSGASIAVNVDGSRLGDAEFMQLISGAIAAAGVSPERVVLEIPEGELATLAPAARSVVRVLNDQGVRLAVDNFGTGFGTLSRLAEIPTQILKIPARFSRKRPIDDNDRAIVRAVAQLAEATGRTCIATQVETLEELKELQALGVHAFQGWCISPPITIESILESISGQDSDHVGPVGLLPCSLFPHDDLCDKGDL